MPYIAANYRNNPSAPVGKWICAPTSGLTLFQDVPPDDKTTSPYLCGQCVSYVKRVCPSLPATAHWTKGAPVKNNNSIAPGTVIATFNASGRYEGHAAIYVSQDPHHGVTVYDQYVTPPSPKPVGERVLRWGAHGNSNNGDKFYVVE
ncbi:BPSL0067 family protein [Dyella acidisoli]|uniref:CHAP domain-containing protein n=2 Tax=Dyella acidisoli TaxID=1867834 RepID=A0ABQ5XUA8_9GAMM|nr:hypothetical protein GCM10007901_41480 [Dyella acidisoli]